MGAGRCRRRALPMRRQVWQHRCVYAQLGPRTHAQDQHGDEAVELLVSASTGRDVVPVVRVRPPGVPQCAEGLPRRGSIRRRLLLLRAQVATLAAPGAPCLGGTAGPTRPCRPRGIPAGLHNAGAAWPWQRCPRARCRCWPGGLAVLARKRAGALCNAGALQALLRIPGQMDWAGLGQGLEARRGPKRGPAGRGRSRVHAAPQGLGMRRGVQALWAPRHVQAHEDSFGRDARASPWQQIS